MKTYDKCPTCGWNPYGQDKEYVVGGSVLRKTTNYQGACGGYDGTSWNEHYRCPKCNSYFVTETGT